MPPEVGFWLVVALMALGGAISFAGRFAMWLVFYLGSKGKLKVRVNLPDENDGSNDDSPR